VTQPLSAQPATSRRDFLTASAVAAGATLLGTLPAVHAAGGDTLKVGLVGCGGRGTGAAAQALKADPNVKLVAMGDAFQDRLTTALTGLSADAAIAAKIDVPANRQFTGLDAYRQVIGAGVDVVILATPPAFRPMQLAAAIAADKHVFCEKPVAVDATGVRSVLETCQAARQKNLSVVSGLCWRYDDPKRQVMQRIHDGQVGDIVTMQANYITGVLWNRARTPEMSDTEWQLRNWLYFTWLSGDFNVEQHIHSLDKMAWAMKDVYPTRCYGLGGRQVRTGPEFGNIFDHMAVVYEWENGVKAYCYCRQQAGCYNETKDYVDGTRGRVNVMQHIITGANPWRLPVAQARRGDMYQNEHNELFAGIRNGRPINNGDYMAKSTLMAIMGRNACYTGQAITWADAMASTENLMPANLRMDGQMAVPAVALPGITRTT
jgi:predicted dehydrogenase